MEKQDELPDDSAFDLYSSAFAQAATKKEMQNQADKNAPSKMLVATDGDGQDSEQESDDSFEFDVQPDDIYDLTVFWDSSSTYSPFA